MNPVRALVAAGLTCALALMGAGVAEASVPVAADPPQPQASTAPADRLNLMDWFYLRKSHQDNLFEIAKGELAHRKARCRTVRDVAKLIVPHHEEMDAKLTGIAERHEVGLPDHPTGEQQQLLRELAALSGRDFDTAWLRVQAAAHEEALALIGQVLERGLSPEVRHLAQAAAPVVRYHLQLVHLAQRQCP